MEKIFLILMMIFISSCDGAIKNIQNQRKTAETSARQSLSKANEAIVMAEKELQEHDELMAFLNCKPQTDEGSKKCDEMRSKLSPENQEKLKDM